MDKAVLPIENSVGGSIHRNYDLLLRHRLHIVGEVQLIVNHCLLGVPGVRKEELKRVLSHPQVPQFCFFYFLVPLSYENCDIFFLKNFQHKLRIFYLEYYNKVGGNDMDIQDSCICCY